ncbi:MAG: UbiA family prenyltransferase [Deltaproteobacteria bacterium]|nr:UbiA family prenyltransferase [Deltaproteobacteria bacterium]
MKMDILHPYLRLYRADVAIITFFGYLFGVQIAGPLDIKDCAIALAVSFISVNFVYSLNALTDREIDRINKPGRPIPSGKIDLKNVRLYVVLLFIISLLYPFLVFNTHLSLFLFLMLPLLGIFYSLEPIHLKRYFALASTTTSAILICPFLMGYTMNTASYEHIPVFFSLFLCGASVIPLKDIEDKVGDVTHGCTNWYFKLGLKGLLLFCFLALAFDMVFVLFVKIDPLLKAFLLIYIFSLILILGLFAFFGWDPKKIYRSVIVDTIVMEVSLFFYYFCMNIGKTPFL